MDLEKSSLCKNRTFTPHLVKQKPFKVPTFLNTNKIVNVVHNHGVYLGTTHRNELLIDPQPLHDPNLENAVVLYRPKKLTPAEKLAQLSSSKIKSKECSIVEVPVVLDPKLSKVLRPHQIDGVRFMYECISGMRDPQWRGCIMADEMGLGKTLQCISLIWTVLKQSPKPNVPYIDKCVICCPSSLVKNWQNEFSKWLGPASPRIFSIENSGDKATTQKLLTKFFCAKKPFVHDPILVISYDSLRIYQDCFRNAQCGLLVCDEAHRLKTTLSLTYKAITNMETKARIIITGTPVQNDLTEYFSLIDFTLQGVLGTYKEFKNKFEVHIERGRDAAATEDERSLGENMLSELTLLANKFTIRRTSEFLLNYLPPKYEYVVFCSLTEYQIQLYKQFLSSECVKSAINNSSVRPLECITHLKKLCNHPCLLEKEGKVNVNGCAKIGANRVSRNGEIIIDYRLSGKLSTVYNILDHVKRKTPDKVVIISNYSKTLNLFEKLLKQENWTFVRLDGSLTVKKRQDVVNKFNNDSNIFAFLLSSKAGGCGINLIGANRLILYDSDWNPANDMQALARIWRDGQIKTCYIYRFISTGTIEEKILQRQAHKQSLSSSVIDSETTDARFSSEYLKKIFSLNEDSPCETHDLFRCRMCINGSNVNKKSVENISSGPASNDLSTWDHLGNYAFYRINDQALKTACSLSTHATFVFQNKSHNQKLPVNDII